jgi:hypothetical protein
MVAVFIAGTLSGCSYPGPPRQWGKVVSAEIGCSALAGSYVERGEIDTRYPEHGPLWLSQALGIYVLNPEIINISYGADGVLRARAMHGTDIIGEAAASRRPIRAFHATARARKSTRKSEVRLVCL